LQISEALVLLHTHLAQMSASARMDAQVLLAEIMAKPRTWIIAHPEAELSSAQNQRFKDSLEKIKTKLPLPYLLGKWEFYGVSINVSPAVLIPRPETELLVDCALEWLKLRLKCQSVLDVGTGSGCIGISIALHQPDIQVIASDLSYPALKVAQFNVHQHKLESKMHLVQAYLIPSLSRRVDLICANLPYIPAVQLNALNVSRYEPTLALNGGKDGLFFIRQLILGSGRYLKPGGLLLCEIEASQGAPSHTLARECYPNAHIEILPDLAGHDRLLKVELIT
jgi:release factor glutamine methyltransferase